MTPAAPPLRVLLWTLLGLLVLLLATSLQFRLPLGETAPYAIDANLPRWLLGFGGGALLAIAGARLDQRWTSPFSFLALSAGAVAGCVAGFTGFGDAGAVAGLGIGALAGAALARWLPPHGVFVATAGLGLASLGLFLASRVKVEPTLGRALTWLAAGDIGHATLVLGIVASLLPVVLLLTRAIDRVPVLGLGVACGLVGPVAFISWWVPLAEARLTRLHGLPRDLMLAFAGGVIVVAVDSVQRWLIGGYGFGLNFPLALMGSPVWLWWVSSQCSGWRRYGARFIAALIAVAGVLFTAFAVDIIRSAT